eukprot:Phypoly_transcript_14959.p1 GENE.Phypoly_transcript_14959~~Phypoly_transcript_14959.p1  ORF type:complete len:138 (+),score=13.33 Phypoly_transcript_14959:239-652(+)
MSNSMNSHGSPNFPYSARNYPGSSPRNSQSVVFGSNPLSPRNSYPNHTTPPRTARAMERKSSQLAIIPESPSGNYRAVNSLSDEERIMRLTILQVLIQRGILDGDPNDYPTKNIYQANTAPTMINNKLGTMHKKMSV